ncbi:MAG: nucleotidyltransferase family protein [Bryobacteraceae bacterium]
MTAAVSPAADEGELCLLLAPSQPPARAIERAAALAARAPDWDRAGKLASGHGVLPHFHRNLAQWFRREAGEETLHRLAAKARNSAVRNLALTSELLAVREAFETEGIRALPFKGPALSALLYGGVAMRPFLDLDLLLAPESVGPAGQILRRLGFEIEPPAPAFDRPFLHKDTAFVRPEGRVRVEVHWRLAEPKFGVAMDFEGLWRRRARVMVCGREVPTLDLEDLLLALAIHAARHCWSSLKWTCDIAELLRTQPWVDLAGVRERAREMGCRRMLAVSLALAAEMLEDPARSRVREAVDAEGAVEAAASHVRRHLFQPPESYYTDFILLLNLRERLADRWRMAWPELIDQVRPAPGSRLPDYARRMGRLLRRYGCEPLVRLAGWRTGKF